MKESTTMQKDLGDYRKSYEKKALEEAHIPEDPMITFRQWFEEAEAAEDVEEPNAMTLSTLGLDGFPKSRVVLLKKFNEEGFVFYTNYSSEKGKAIEANPKVCLSFFWPGLERQIIIKGVAEKVSEKMSDEYFDSRPLGSRLGALASDQSSIIPSRTYLEDRLKKVGHAHENAPVRRPDFWGGYVVRPSSIEFWQGRPNRLHDRIRFSVESDQGWKMERLAP